MAIGYVCEDCGWKESVHLYGGANIPNSDRPKLIQVLPGYYCTFEECSGYFPPLAESDEITLQLAVVNSYEAQH